MSFLAIVGLLYVVYSFYTLYIACVSNYPVLYVILGLGAIWGVYLSFFLGFRTAKKRTNFIRNEKESQFLFSQISNWKTYQYLLATTASWVCSILCTRFYTGKGLMQVILGFGSNASLYNQYQRYFIESNIATFSIGKIIYILMMVYCTVLLLWSLIGIFLLAKKKRKIHYVFCISNIIAYLYFGLARGTNFELFIIFVTVVYIMLRKGNKKRKQKKEKSWKKIILLGVLGLGFVMAFRSVVMARGIEFNTYISAELTLKQDSFLAQTFPLLTNIALSVYNYLGFGIYTIGASIAEIRFETVLDFLASLIPFGYPLFFGESFDFFLREQIDIGVRWVADFNRFTNMTGLPLFYILLAVWGRTLAKLRVKSHLLKELVYCISFIELLSLPVGNFLFASSFNILTLVVVIGYIILDKFKFKVK